MSIKVLIVDDSVLMRDNIRGYIKILGHEVVGEATTGNEAVNLCKSLSPDLITMDITMPEVNGIKDGIDAVKQIILTDYKAKIIMVTSHGEQDKVIRAIQNGASNYLLKPLKIDKLEEIISKLDV